MQIKKIQIKKIMISIALLLLITFLFYRLVNTKTKTPELTLIQNIAKEYYNLNKNYGVMPSIQSKNSCFSQNIFLRNKQIDELFVSGKVEDVSCRFNAENFVATKWSVSFLINKKVYCTDYTGLMRETPGFTISTSCNENAE